MHNSNQKYGLMAKEELGLRLPLQVLQSHRGFYIGTADEEGPVSRESEEYWPTFDDAEKALLGSQEMTWTQRTEA